MTLHHLIVTFKTLGACASLEPRYCRMAHSVASRDALALATAEVLGLSLPDISCPRRRVDRITANVCFWHKADIPTRSTNVRFWGQSGHGADSRKCPLLTQSGHWPRQSRVTGVTEYRVGTAASVRLDVEGLDHLAPLLRFVGDEFPEIGRRA